MKQKSVTIVMVDNDRLYIDPTASTEYEGKCSELQLSTFYFKIFHQPHLGPFIYAPQVHLAIRTTIYNYALLSYK